MSQRQKFNDPEAKCPHCESSGRVTFSEIPTWQMHWIDDDEEEHVEYMPPSRDYKCHNCDGEWIRLETEE